MGRPSQKAQAPAVPVTVKDAVDIATRYWEAKGASSRAMRIRAKRVAGIIGEERELDGLSPVDGTFILTELARPFITGPEAKVSATGGFIKRAGIYATQSQATYYAAFTRALNLAGVSTERWPSGPTPPRRVREPLSEADLDALQAHFLAVGHEETATLLLVLRGTGMRVDVEALRSYPWAWAVECANVGGPYELRVRGKGGHERVIPISHPVATLLREDGLIKPMQRLSYSCHLKRWNKAVKHLGIKSKLPTPHAVRHFYATRAYEKSGKNLVAVQLLLGHADPSTTARYIGVDMSVLRSAIEDDPGTPGEAVE